MIFRSAANDFSISWERFSDVLTSVLRALPYRKTLSGKSMGVRGMSLPCPTSHKLFFSQKGSLPSDFFCTNTLRWTFCLYILHRDFTGKWKTTRRFRFTNINRLVINRVTVKGLTKAFSCHIFAGGKHNRKHKAYGLQKDCMHRRKTVERKTYGRKGEGRAP